MDVGFIGLGNMGKAMATNVIKAGFDLIVYDVREEPIKELVGLGAKVAGSPREVGQYAEIVEIAVVDDAQVEEVVLREDNGLLWGANRGSVIAIHSTVHPNTPKKIGPLATAKGVGVVDAQMSGGTRGATSQSLCFMVGGEKSSFDKCRPVLAASGREILHMGDLGTGSITKLAQQTMVLINMMSACEGMQLAEKAGISLETFQKLVHVSSGQSAIADNWLRFIEDQKTGGPHRMELFYKGVVPAIELAHELGTSMPGLALAQQLLDRVIVPER